MYVVPRYTEISHFRAPYKNSAIYTGVEGMSGLGLLSTSSSFAPPSTSPTRSSPSTTPTSSVSAEEAAKFAASFMAGQAKLSEAQSYDMDGRATAFGRTLQADGLTRYRAENGIAPWQQLPPNWQVLIVNTKYKIAMDPNSTWRKNLRVEAKKAFGYGQKLSQPIGEWFLGKVTGIVTNSQNASTGASMVSFVGSDKERGDMVRELVWRLSVEEAQTAKDELLRDQKSGMAQTTTFGPSKTQAALPTRVTPSGGGGDTAQQQPPPAAPPQLDISEARPADQGYSPPGTATAGVMKALPWVAAVSVAGVVVWLAVKKKK